MPLVSVVPAPVQAVPFHDLKIGEWFVYEGQNSEDPQALRVKVTHRGAFAPFYDRPQKYAASPKDAHVIHVRVVKVEVYEVQP